MRREKASVRSSHTVGLDGRRFVDPFFKDQHGVKNRVPVQKDFRKNLCSVFLDNINPQVDVECLWEVFKVFGRVKDVYLSSKKRPRRSLFAFICFDTLEEATKVASTVAGMHVYGWPISAKVAEQDWNSRKIVEKGKLWKQ